MRLELVVDAASAGASRQRPMVYPSRPGQPGGSSRDSKGVTDTWVAATADAALPRPVPDAREGDEQWLAVLFRRTYVGLVRMAYCLGGDRSEAEDLVQDAFCSLQRHSATLRDANAAEHYLRVAVLNGSRSQLRRLVRERARRRPAAVPAPDPADGVVERDERARVVAAVRRLPPRQREVLVCRYYLELSEAEIAALLGISAGSVKTHAHRGVRSVERALVGP